MIPSPLHATPIQRRRRLAEAVTALARGIADGECMPDPIELLALAQVCDDLGLPIEAARVRSWLPSAFETCATIARLLKGDDA